MRWPITTEFDSARLGWGHLSASEKATQLACGMSVVLARYTWGLPPPVKSGKIDLDW